LDDPVGMEFVADLASLRDFFGVEPTLQYPNLPVYENCVEVEAELGDKTVWLMFVPFQGFGELRLVDKPFSVVKLMFSDISHLSIRKTAEDHYMLIRFARKQTSNLTLQLRPHVLLFWGNGTPDEEDNDDFLQPTPIVKPDA